jgi:hypothetical protein
MIVRTPSGPLGLSEVPPTLMGSCWGTRRTNRQPGAIGAKAPDERQTREAMARWRNGEQTIQFLINRGRLESFEAADLTTPAEALIARARLRVEATAKAALKMSDIDGAYVAAYDAYRMAAESLLARQGLRATGGDGSHMAVEDAVSAQFASDIRAFAKPTFERLRRTRHSAQYF